jgi:hypothetical protein
MSFASIHPSYPRTSDLIPRSKNQSLIFSQKKIGGAGKLQFFGYWGLEKKKISLAFIQGTGISRLVRFQLVRSLV